VRGETSDVWVCPEKERAAMQRRLSEVRPATLADQLSGLAKLHDSALKERWRTLYQTAPPARISSSLLLKVIGRLIRQIITRTAIHFERPERFDVK
jgi:hypothetical protein